MNMDLIIHATVCVCSKDELTERIARAISQHLTENRHPDGIAPTVLAADLVARLQNGHQVLLTREDLDD